MTPAELHRLQSLLTLAERGEPHERTAAARAAERLAARLNARGSRHVPIEPVEAPPARLPDHPGVCVLPWCHWCALINEARRRKIR